MYASINDKVKNIAYLIELLWRLSDIEAYETAQCQAYKSMPNKWQPKTKIIPQTKMYYN